MSEDPPEKKTSFLYLRILCSDKKGIQVKKAYAEDQKKELAFITIERFFLAVMSLHWRELSPQFIFLALCYFHFSYSKNNITMHYQVTLDFSGYLFLSQWSNISKIFL